MAMQRRRSQKPSWTGDSAPVKQRTGKALRRGVYSPATTHSVVPYGTRVCKLNVYVKIGSYVQRYSLYWLLYNCTVHMPAPQNELFQTVL